MSRKPTTVARDRADEQLRQRKVRDRALALVLMGTILFMPPVAAVFDLKSFLFGLPVVLVYIFGVWALLILGTAALSRQLQDSSEAEAGSTDIGGRETGV